MKKKSKSLNTSEENLSNESIKNRAIRSSAVLVGRQFLMRGLGIIGIFVLAKILSPEIFGIFAIIQFIVLLFEQTSGFGLPLALIRQKEAVNENQLRSVFTIQFVFVLFAGCLIYTFAPNIVEHYELNHEVVYAIQLMIIALIFSSLSLIPKLILQRNFYHDKVAQADIQSYIIYLISAIVMSLFGYGLWSLIFATIFRSVVKTIVLFRYCEWRPSLLWDFSDVRPLISFAIPSQISKIIDLAYRSIVPIIIGSLFGVHAVGILNLARTLLDTAIAQPIAMIGRVQLRLFSNLQDNLPSITRNIHRSYLLGSSGAFLAAAILIGLNEPLILMILGDKWIDAAPAMLFMAIGYAFLSIWSPSTQALKALGDAWRPLYLLLLRTVLVLIVTYLVSDIYGALSFPIAIAISEPFTALISVFLLKKHLKLNVFSKVYGAILAALIVIAIALLFFI